MDKKKIKLVEEITDNNNMESQKYNQRKSFFLEQKDILYKKKLYYYV